MKKYENRIIKNIEILKINILFLKTSYLRLLSLKTVFNLSYILLLIILLLMLPLFLLSSPVYGSPPLPTEFYGQVYSYGSIASSGVGITIKYNGTLCSSSFNVVNPGYFGLITCPIDDPETTIQDGALLTDNVSVYYNGQPTVILNGDSSIEVGGFHFLNVSYPVPVCGDGTCDPFFETFISCPQDCINPNATYNGTINNTNTATNTTNTTNGGSGGGGSGGGSGGGESSTTASGSSGGGGSGGGSGGGGSSGGAMSSSLGNFLEGITGISGLEGFCNENWICDDWNNCSIDGIQTRTCEDMNHCGSFDDKPPEVQECIYEPSCFNGIQDGDETGVDCGGNCKSCPTCDDGIQNCQILDNGTKSCELGIDCGGPCRPCDSCFDGVQDWTETGVDCGGLYCKECSLKPIFEFPELICEKSINPLTNGGLWFFLIVLLLILIRTYFYLKKITKIHKDYEEDEYKRAKAYFVERRKMVLFMIIAILITLFVYLFFYEFLLCDLKYGYLWWFGLLLLILPMMVYFIWRFMDYNDKIKLIKLGALSEEHSASMEKVLDFENKQLISIENEIKSLIEKIVKDNVLHELIIKFPDLKNIYKSIIELFFEYKKNKTPYGIEKELCQKVYDIETDDTFKDLATKYPDIWMLYYKLKILYQHYESKQELYDRLEEEKERLKKHLEDNSLPAPEKSKFEELDNDDKEEQK